MDVQADPSCRWAHIFFVGSFHTPCLILEQKELTKPTKWHVRSAKTRISLGIRPVWSESSLSAWRKLGSIVGYPLSAQQRLCQIGWMPRLIWVFAGRTATLLVLSHVFINIWMNAIPALVFRFAGWQILYLKKLLLIFIYEKKNNNKKETHGQF